MSINKKKIYRALSILMILFGLAISVIGAAIISESFRAKLMQFRFLSSDFNAEIESVFKKAVELYDQGEFTESALTCPGYAEFNLDSGFSIKGLETEGIRVNLLRSKGGGVIVFIGDNCRTGYVYRTNTETSYAGPAGSGVIFYLDNFGTYYSN